MAQQEVVLFWFRRDLRVHDNKGLYKALKSGYPVVPIFIFDDSILKTLPKNDARVSFIHQELTKLNALLGENFSSGIRTFHGRPEEVISEICKEYKVLKVFTNRDYEPYAATRDKTIEAVLQQFGATLVTFKDQVIFEQNEIVKADGTPYVVYTPYKRKWLEAFHENSEEKQYSSEKELHHLLKQTNTIHSLQEMGFESSEIKTPNFVTTSSRIENYEATRNFPGLSDGTTKLGTHLRFGTVSVREMVNLGDNATNQVFLSELIWREFFMQILWHFPHTVTQSFKPKYDRIVWRNNEAEFEKWKSGNTGYALVDAGMRELNATGFMHNRVRMLVASFLCKHLLIDWRWGEAYFAEKLLDFELASNVGNWQWAAGSGVDAAPYFRIFNPMTQVDKFDKQLKYINTWVPELQEFNYPEKMVDHKMARERCLATYKEALA